MNIEYWLTPNLMTPDPNDHSARVSAKTIFNQEDIVRLCVQRGSTLTATDIRAVLNLSAEVISDELASGNAVNLPLVNLRPSVTGVFTSITDSFDTSRHLVKASVSAGSLLSDKMSSAKVTKIASSQPAPELLEFTDIKTRTTNSIVSPSNIGQVAGSELKFNPENADEGIFFISLSTGVETKVEVVASRTEGKLLFHIPGSLVAGDYRLEVRKGYGNAAAIRTGSLSDLLQVS